MLTLAQAEEGRGYTVKDINGDARSSNVAVCCSSVAGS